MPDVVEYSDNFNRADGSMGANWAALQGVVGLIDNNLAGTGKLGPLAAGGNTVWVYLAGGIYQNPADDGTDCYFQIEDVAIDLDIGSASVVPGTGVRLELSPNDDGSGDRYRAEIATTNNGSTWTASITRTPASGSPVTLASTSTSNPDGSDTRFERNGGSLRLLADDVELLATTHGSPYAATPYATAAVLRQLLIAGGASQPDPNAGEVSFDNFELGYVSTGFDGSYVPTAAGTAVRIREAGGDYAALYDASGDRWEA